MDPIILDSKKQRFGDINYYYDGKYYTNKWADKRRLHQRVWEDNAGPIPEGWHVHHIDENKHNNAFSNLQCLSPSEHSAMHPNLLPFPKECLDAAAKWHKSDEGRAWHKKHAEDVGARQKQRERNTFTCIQCGRLFKALRSPSGMCDQVCRKRRHAGMSGGATYRNPGRKKGQRLLP